MNPALRLAEQRLSDIAGELVSLERMVAWLESMPDSASPESRMVRASIVANGTASVYNGIESLLDFLTRELDDYQVKSSDASHAELLAQASLDVPGSRPPIVAGDTLALLHELRRFRHVVRHSYGSRLRPEPVEQNYGRLRTVVSMLRRDFDALRGIVDR